MNMIASAAAVLTGAISLETRSSDPIFDLIEVHKSKAKAVRSWVDQHCRLEKELPKGRRQSSVNGWETEIVETDDPLWIEAERNLHQAYEDETEAALALIAEPPPTIAGAIALLQYVAEVEVDGMEFPDGLVESDEQMIGKDWSFYLHKNLAATFAAHAA
jgi:hypothetical protein